MRFRIRGGTADNSTASLCLTCRFATIVNGRSLSDEIVECGKLSDHARITFSVTSCTAYTDRRRAALHEMEELAWILRSDAKKNTVGFVKASELNRFVLAEDYE